MFIINSQFIIKWRNSHKIYQQVKDIIFSDNNLYLSYVYIFYIIYLFMLYIMLYIFIYFYIFYIITLGILKTYNDYIIL